MPHARLALLLATSLLALPGAATAAPPRPGQLVTLEQGIVGAVDPTTGLWTQLAAPYVPGWLGSLIRSPADGQLYALDPAGGFEPPGLLRIDLEGRLASPISLGGAIVGHSHLAIGSTGAVYATGGFIDVGGTYRGLVVGIDPLSGEQTPISSGGLLTLPVGIAVEPTGMLLVVDSRFGGAAVIRIDPATGVQSVLSTGGGLFAASEIAVDLAGFVWVTAIRDDFASLGTLIRIDPATGEQIEFSTNLDPGSIAVEPSGTLLLTAPLVPFFPRGSWIQRFDPTTGAATPLFDVPFSSVGGVVFEPDGSWLLAVSDQGYGVRIDRIDPDARSVSNLFFASRQTEPLLLDARRHLMALAPPSGLLIDVDPSTGRQEILHDPVRFFPPAIPSDGYEVRGAIDAALLPDGRRIVLESRLSNAPERLVVSTPAGVTLSEIDVPGAYRLAALDADAVVVAVYGGEPGLRSTLLREIDFSGAPPRNIPTIPLDSISDLHASTDRSLHALEYDRNARTNRLVRIDRDSGTRTVVPLPPGWSFASLQLDGLGYAWLRGLRGYAWETVRVDLASGAAEALLGTGLLVRPRCRDRLDQDRNGLVDWPAEPGCSGPDDDSEWEFACGLGAEPLALLVLLRRRRATACGSSRSR